MKRSIITLFVLLGALTACERYDADDHKFGNVVYLNVSQTSPVQLATFSNNRETYDCTLQAALTYPAAQDVQVSLAVDPSLVAAYNARYGTAWPMLDEKYYTLSAPETTIAAGRTVSDVVTLQLRELMGEGEEQTGALPLDETFLVPVRISGASMDVLRGSDVAYYVVKRSSAITVAAQLGEGNWINFPTLDKYGTNSQAWNGLTAMTYEALIYIDEFATTDAEDMPVSISSVLGVEQYLLLRIGDTNFERQQLQFDGSGSGSQFGKFPGKDATKNLEAGRWYHVACTYDQAARTVRIYVDGKIQSEESGVGIATQNEDNRINHACALRLLPEQPDRGQREEIRRLRRCLPVLHRQVLRREAPAEWQDRRGARVVRGADSRTDLGEHVQRRESGRRPDAAGLLEVQRGGGQYRP